MKAKKRHLGKLAVFAGAAVCCAVAAAESRILHLPGGFAQPYGSYTTGGEFPGAIRVAEFAPEAGKKDGTVLVLWSIEGACEWEVPTSRGQWTECRDLFGNVIEPSVVSGRKLRLTECPIYLKF